MGRSIQEAFNSKGPNGSKPCLSCKNVVQFAEVAGHSYLVGIDAHPRYFDRATDDDAASMVDCLRRIAESGRKKDLEKTEQALGLNYHPEGLLFQSHLSPHVKAVSGWHRDWMHVFLVSGVCNILLQQTIIALRREGVMPNDLATFFGQFRLPKAWGCVDPEWFSKARIGRVAEDKDGWKGFASELLTIWPILRCFMDKAIEPSGRLPRHVQCVRLMDRILRLASSGPKTAAEHIGVLEAMMADFAAVYREEFADLIKPKFHHMHHLADHARNIGVLLSCFPSERKHKQTKALANHTFRHFETALTADLLNQQLCLAREGVVYRAQYLERPRFLEALGIYAATTAKLRCGQVLGIESKKVTTL